MKEEKKICPICCTPFITDEQKKWTCPQCQSAGEMDVDGSFILDMNGPVIQSAKHNYHAASMKKTLIVSGTCVVVLIALGVSVIFIPIFVLDVAITFVAGWGAMMLLDKIVPGRWICPVCKKELEWDNRKGSVYSDKCPYCGVRIKDFKK